MLRKMASGVVADPTAILGVGGFPVLSERRGAFPRGFGNKMGASSGTPVVAVGSAPSQLPFFYLWVGTGAMLGRL
ncbi:MAG: hypothetical protein CVV03_03615 [Firmicutes bacterium HGW-Firmicutes-8]|nr:MAG: hypothetical protein CVV03_03615 [Firmicutes bacterium HGW-Firmicutes-8]